MAKITQHDRILQYIKDFGSITTIEAFSELGITKLSTRVSEMRDRGINIVDMPETSRNRYNEICHYKRYFLGGSK